MAALAIPVVGVHFQHSVAKSAVHFPAIGIFQQRGSCVGITKGIARYDGISFSDLLFAFALSGNAEDAIFDCYPTSSFFISGRICFEAGYS